MKKFKQVETRLVTTTYHVSAKDVNEVPLLSFNIAAIYQIIPVCCI